MFDDAPEGAIWPAEPVALLECVVDQLLRDLWPAGPTGQTGPTGGAIGPGSSAASDPSGGGSVSAPALGLEPAEALVRAKGLLAQCERLSAAAALAVADVDARELWALDAGGGTRTWLRSQACGDTGQLALGKRLARWAGVRGAVLVGQIGARGALAVATALEAVERLEADGPLAEDQVLGVLVNGVPALLAPWCAASVVQDCRTEQMDARLQTVTDTITGCVADSSAPAGRRLEPALVLLARALGPGALTDALGTFLDALEPERVADRERRLWQNRSLRLSRRPDGGWDLRALLTDETGFALHARLSALPARPGAQDAATRSPGTAGPAGSQDQDASAQAAAARDASAQAAAAAAVDGTAAWTDPHPGPHPGPPPDPPPDPRHDVGSGIHGATGPGTRLSARRTLPTTTASTTTASTTTARTTTARTTTVPAPKVETAMVQLSADRVRAEAVRRLTRAGLRGFWSRRTGSAWPGPAGSRCPRPAGASWAANRSRASLSAPWPSSATTRSPTCCTTLTSPPSPPPRHGAASSPPEGTRHRRAHRAHRAGRWTRPAPATRRRLPTPSRSCCSRNPATVTDLTDLTDLTDPTDPTAPMPLATAAAVTAPVT